MKIDWDGRTWEFDSEEISFRQGELIYRYYQMTIDDYNSGLDKMDQRSYHVAYWLMLQQAGRKDVGLANCGDVQVIPFMMALTEARIAQAEAERQAAEAEALPQPGPDPTPPVPTSPPPDGPQSPTSAYPPDMTPQPGHPYQPQHGPTGYSASP